MKATGWIGMVALALLGVALTQGVGDRFSGPGMMQGYGMGSGMMGGAGMMSIYPAQAQPIPEAEAKGRLEAYARHLAPEARIKEVMAFSENFYAQVVDTRGNGLGELLLDRYSGNVYPEPGPNLMWNGRSGMGLGMMDHTGMRPQLAPQATRYDKAAAQKLADQFLRGYLPGAQVVEGQAFSGYYTFDFGRKEVEGMLSVNAYSGEVWVHTWHGIFLGE